MLRWFELLVATPVVAAMGCHPFPTQPRVGIAVVSTTAGLEFHFVNCSDAREIPISDVQVRAAGPDLDPSQRRVLCGVRWQGVLDMVSSGQSWGYATVPGGYARLGACDVLPRPGRFVVSGDSAAPTAFTFDDGGKLRAEPACPRRK